MIVLSKISNVPQIRFKGFTDAWEQRKLGEITEKFEYGLNAAATDFDGVNQYLRITDIDDESREFNKTSLTSPDTNLALADNYLLKQGDILFARTGASVGKTYQYKESDGRVYYAGFLIRARILSGFNPGFVFQNTLTKRYENFVSITSQRSGQPGINAQEYAGFKLLLPKFEEQEQISDLFIRLDNLITLHQRKYDALKSMKKTLLSKMFPKDGKDVPEIRFKEFTDAWEQRKLGSAINVRSGKDYKHLDEGDVPVYGTGGYMLSVSEALENTQDAIGIGRKGTIDKPFVLKAPFWTVDTLFYCIPKGNNYLGFLYPLFQSINWKLYDESTGVPSLSKTAIEGVTINLTGKDEQYSIGEYFEIVDTLITLHQRKLDELKNMKKTLLQQMFV